MYQSPHLRGGSAPGRISGPKREPHRPGMTHNADMSLRTRLVAASILLSLSAAGCGSQPTATAGNGTAPSGTVTSATAMKAPGCPIPRAPTAVTTADPGTHAYDRDVWQTLLYHHDKIRREVKRLPNGLAAVTESDDPAIATLIKDHTLAMKDRMESGARVRTWDPVFRELFDRHAKVKLEVVLTEKGVSIVETTDDPETLRLLKSHSAGVTDMVREGGRASQRETPFVND